MLIQGFAAQRAHRQIVVGLFVGVERATLDVGRDLVQHAPIAGDAHVAACGQWQPQEIVGTARAYAAVGRRMPPVLHVAFRELVRRTQQQVVAHALRLRVQHRHRILQLIAETKRAARLIVAAARKKPAGDGLVQQPAVGEHIDRRIGRVHMHRAQRAPPFRTHCGQRFLRDRVSAQALRQPRGIAGITAHAEPEYQRALGIEIEIECQLDRRARIQSGADPSRQPFAPECGRIAQAAVAADELDAVAADAALRRFAIAVCVEKADPIGEFGIVGIAREDRSGLRIDLGDQVRLGSGPQIAEYPFDVTGRRDAPRPRREIANAQLRELDRRLHTDVDDQRAGDAILDVLVNAVTEAVTDPVLALAATRQRRW